MPLSYISGCNSYYIILFYFIIVVNLFASFISETLSRICVCKENVSSMKRLLLCAVSGIRWRLAVFCLWKKTFGESFLPFLLLVLSLSFL